MQIRVDLFFCWLKCIWIYLKHTYPYSAYIFNVYYSINTQAFEASGCACSSMLLHMLDIWTISVVAHSYMECYNFTCYSYAVLCLASSYLFIQFQLNSAVIYAACWIVYGEEEEASVPPFYSHWKIALCTLHTGRVLGGNRFGIHATDFFFQYSVFTETQKNVEFVACKKMCLPSNHFLCTVCTQFSGAGNGNIQFVASPSPTPLLS